MLKIRTPAVLRKLALCLLAPALLTAQASTTALSAIPAKLLVRQDAKLGTILTARNGKTLYLFTKDGPNVSNCNDNCAAAWPPLLSTTLPSLPGGVPGALSLVTRKDGTQQVAYNGMPLYYWTKDKKLSDTTGQGVGEVWYAVNPAPVVKVATDEKLGEYLVGPNGKTLYLFTKDEGEISTCNGNCAAAWPPLLSAYLPDSANPDGNLGTSERQDGTQQVTYGGQPLYYWVKDAKPGDTTGHNVGNVWFVVKPAAKE